MNYEILTGHVGRSGLLLRGGFHPDSGDQVPRMAGGQRPGTILLLGNAGGAMWRAFRASPEAASARSLDDPLDRWSRRVITALATDLGAEAVFPFGGPPYYPFQQWARRSEPVWPSPLGVLIHRDYGLWHAYRGALAFEAVIALPDRPEGESSPCESCAQKPCLSECPVSAFAAGHYDVPACAAHLATLAGRDCVELGCRARRACPVGEAFRYEAAQADFHMRAFLEARSEDE